MQYNLSIDQLIKEKPLIKLCKNIMIFLDLYIMYGREVYVVHDKTWGH